VLAIKPDYAQVPTNRGVTLRDLERLEDALVSYDNVHRFTRPPRRRLPAACQGREAERFGGLEIDHQLELVGDCAGRSAGFVPRKIRST
jgi:hypothetical protein